ncbi:hypothetical protein D9M72_458910 [compost metagenome]
MLHEDHLHGLQVEFGRQVHDGQILVIEVPVLLGGVTIVLHQMREELFVGDQVPVEVHRHEARELQEARIDHAHEARLRPRHRHDDVVAEPFDRPLFGKLIDARRIDAGVDRSAHQRHRRRRQRIVRRFHQGDGGEHRHCRLTDADHMGVRAQEVQHLDDVVDVIVEIESAFAERHHAGVDPVRDVDVGMRQQGFHGAAQQRRVVAGHRRHDQNLRIGGTPLGQGALEMDEVAEG